MATEKRKPLYDWRAALTPDEKVKVKEIERELKAAAKARAKASAKMQPYRNRAIHRCKRQLAAQ